MAIIQNNALAAPLSTSIRGGENDYFLRLLMLYYGLLPLSDVVSGALTHFYEITWFAIAYKGGAIFVMVVFFIAGRISKGYAAFAISIIVLLVLGAGIRQSSGLGSATEDFLYIARGPILLNSILIVLLSLDLNGVDRIARTYSISTWLATSLSVIISDRLGVSLTSYGAAGYGSKGFYQAANEVTLTFILSWWYIQVRFANTWWKSGLLFVASVYLIYTLGTKSGLVAMPILAMWYVGRRLGFNWIVNLGMFLAVAIVAMAYADVIFLAVLPYLKAADASAFFINTYGVNSTLTGGRFADLDFIISTIQSFSFFEVIFGIGFSTFWFEIAGKSVESDLIDTLGGGGIIFAGWFYGILIWGYVCSKTPRPLRFAVDTPWAFVFIAVILYSIFVGHVAFAASPLISVGILFALAYKEHARENRGRSVLV